jgi:hypothetical protein
MTIDDVNWMKNKTNTKHSNMTMEIGMLTDVTIKTTK